jgi:hypothetical protein
VVDASALKSGNILGGMGINGLNFGVLGTMVMWIALILVIGGALGVGIFWFISRKKYNMKIWIFGRVSGVPMLKFIDAGKQVAFGNAGDKLIQLRKQKKWLPIPQIQMGKDIYWFYEREDGEYINFSLEDIDKKQKLAGAYYVDTDMRMQRLGIEKNLRERLTKQSFFEKYGTTIAGVIFVIMITVALVVLFSKLKDVTTSMDKMSQSVGAMADSVNKFYSARTGGESPADVNSGGLIPAFLIPLFFGNKFRRKKWFQE